MVLLTLKESTLTVFRRALIILLLVNLLAGCAVDRHDQLRGPIWDHPLADSPDTGTILRTNPPGSLDPSSAFHFVENADVVFVGEQHNHPPSHRVQFQILKALHQRKGSLGIGFELFRQSQQNLLSAWSGNAINFRTLKNQIEASDSELALLESYRPILEYARENNLAIRALKPDEEDVQSVRNQSHREKNPSRGPSDTKRAADRQQKKFLRTMFEEHVPTGRGFETFLAVQQYWEKQMASHIHSFLQESQTPDRMLVLTGNYHVAHDFGIPTKLRDLGPWESRSVIILPTDRNLRSFLDFPERSEEVRPRIADLIWWVEPQPAPAPQ